MAEGSSTGESLTGCAPEGDVFARLSVKPGSKLLSNFAESLKSQDNKDDEDRAKNMYLESLAPGTIKSIVDSRGLFLTWYNHTYPGKTVTLPISEMEIKTFFVSCAKAGFTYTRLTNNILRGICMWVTNNQPSPAKTYPELGSTIMKYLRKEVGEMDIFPKKPLFEQDLEHIVDSTGIGTPAALQLSFLHCLSASCGARPTSLAETYVREEIDEVHQELGLGSYPAGAGLTIQDVEFSKHNNEDNSLLRSAVFYRVPDNRHVFVVTPKKPGSPYCPVTLGFLHIARRGAFKENPANAWRNKNFIYKDEAKKWPLFAQVDTSTQTLKNTMAITTNQLSRTVTSSISSVGFNPREVSHRSYRSLRRLGGWSPKSAIVHLHIKKIIEEYSDTLALITPANIMIRHNNLQTEEERVRRLRNMPTAYNYCLVLPQKNITTQTEAEALLPEEYEKFLREYEPLKKLQAEDPTNRKKINHVKETATSLLQKKKRTATRGKEEAACYSSQTDNNTDPRRS
ncbi:unnamed protein product [Porites lobata]|uniref:Uncharacterized protein n=1 Tax=Porites lobata TaxID=104759 RepID=A0ABN8RM20_9CNID|nr:unnamed protein product [Porites lobata]